MVQKGKNAALSDWTQFFVLKYDKYNEAEKKRHARIAFADYIGVPVWVALYIWAATRVVSFEGFDATELTGTEISASRFDESVVIFAALTSAVIAVFMLYQHARVLPYPLAKSVEMFEVMRPIGRWIFLTRQTLATQAVHATLTWMSLRFPSMYWLRVPSYCMSVLVAGLGIFVTIQYFVLVAPDAHFKEDNRMWASRGVPHRAIAHMVHIPAAFLAFADILVVKNRAALLLLTPTLLELFGFYFAYVCFYLSIVHVVHKISGHWPYGFMIKLGSSVKRWVLFSAKQFVILSLFVFIANYCVTNDVLSFVL